jgi:hypothetical protein
MEGYHALLRDNPVTRKDAVLKCAQVAAYYRCDCHEPVGLSLMCTMVAGFRVFPLPTYNACLALHTNTAE